MLPRLSLSSLVRTSGPGRRRWRTILVPRNFWDMCLASIKGQSLVDMAQPTQLELTAQADWDETELQVKSLIALRMSSNLRTHIWTMSEETWTSLNTVFGTPHFTGIFKDYELAHSIRLTMGENPEIWIQRLWTILERLQMNRCVISNYLQGMLLLKAIPREWDTIAQMYCNGMQMTNITFSGVR